MYPIYDWRRANSNKSINKRAKSHKSINKHSFHEGPRENLVKLRKWGNHLKVSVGLAWCAKMSLRANAKFCVAWSLLMFEDDVLDQTVEQYISLLKSKAEIINSNVLQYPWEFEKTPKACFSTTE